MRGLAYRRHQEAKKRQKMLRKLKHEWNWNPPDGDQYVDERRLQALTKTPKICSCHMCGNPRKYFNEKTMQERRADLDINMINGEYN